MYLHVFVLEGIVVKEYASSSILGWIRYYVSFFDIRYYVLTSWVNWFWTVSKKCNAEHRSAEHFFKGYL